jgi:hypothetical protein
MAQLSDPIMTPLGVVYRSFCNNQDEALKYAQWAVKLFGGDASAFRVIGPSTKGFYEAAIMATVPEGTKLIKPPKKMPSTAWQKEPAHAYVLFDNLEQPLALYFFEHELVVKPREEPPLMAYHAMTLK